MMVGCGDPALDLNVLARRYQFRDAPSVLNFVRNDSPLIEFLLEARDQLDLCLPDTAIYLGVECDPRAPQHCHLCLSIGTSLDVDGVCQALDQFDHCWWLQNLHRAQNRLRITVELM